MIAAPTGTGKTLAAFLCAIDQLIREGPYLADTTRVLYVSPLRALANDVQKNLLAPLAGIAARDAFVPTLRVLVRTGDTPQAERQAMVKQPPHLLVTTPESLAILLNSVGGRKLLAGIRSVIIDEIHALVPSKRGAHLALALERLEHLTGQPMQRIGLSATQKPLELIANVLGGRGRTVEIIDAGHLRELDLGVEIPPSPLEAVVSHELWAEAHARIVELVLAHRTTLVFSNTRALAERLARRLSERLTAAGLDGDMLVTCHHGSLSKERRLDAEQRLKAGSLRVLVATATLELGIDIGDVDLVVQIGSARSIATFLQRAGRAGHGVGRLPKARVLALTPDELIEAGALLRAVRGRELDALRCPEHPWDVLAQHLVAAAASAPWLLADLHRVLTRAWMYRDVDLAAFARLVALHAQGRSALVHWDPATSILRGTRRAALAVVTSGGAIPDTALLQVREDPGDLVVGTVDEDFALESSPGDIFQLGNTAWRILKVDGRAGVVRVVNAQGAPPTIPFWFGEAPGRTRELSQAVGRLRAEADSAMWFTAHCDFNAPAAAAAWEHLSAAKRALGELPTDQRVVAERFFDDNGTQHLVIHACFGTRINRAWGLALRKRFCTGFGFELEAAATDEGLALSLGPTASFALQDVFAYLSPASLRATLIQACVTGGQFETRWRWVATTALIVERSRNGQRVPPHLLRLRANDALVAAFPGALTCPDNLPPGNLRVPEDHPLVAQTVRDLLHDLLDLDGLISVLTALKRGEISVHTADVAEPSPLARSLIAARPYAFLDDVAFENRRTRAIAPPSADPPAFSADLDPDAVAAVRAEAWPEPRNREELHEVLTWIGWLTDAESAPWQTWLAELAAAGRAERTNVGWQAVGTTREPLACWRGRLEALGPILSEDPILLELEQAGVAMRVTIAGQVHWCHRRLAQRILAHGRDRRRQWQEPVGVGRFLRFIAQWQGVTPDLRRHGVAGTRAAVQQLAGLELPAGSWGVALATRVRDFRPEHLDELALAGEIAWGRLWTAPASDPDGRADTMRRTPIAMVPRSDLGAWLSLAGPAGDAGLSGPAREVLAVLRTRGASFLHELPRHVRQLPATIEDALAELVGAGLATADALAGLRWLLLSSDRRRGARPPAGRWSLLRDAGLPPPEPAHLADDLALLVARTLLQRTGVVFRLTWARERIHAPWRDVVRALRQLELRGEVRGGRFVAGFSGEQFALPEAAERLREADAGEPLTLAAADPLNYSGFLVPGERVRADGEARITL